MLLLPSGKAIELSANRAKYHALRRPGPNSHSPHQELYGLVDILYRKQDADGSIRRGWTEYEIDYSPYTLADFNQAPDWDLEDKQVLRQWLKERSQYLLIESARARLDEQQHDYTSKQSSAPQRLYSLLRQRLEHLSLQSASRTQWQGLINNMQHQGLRQEELVWSGLGTKLEQYPAEQKLDKQQLLDAIDFSNIRLELSSERIRSLHGDLSFIEVAQIMSHQAVYRASLKLDGSCHCVLRYRDMETNYRIGVVKTLAAEHPMALNKVWFALDPYGRAVLSQSNTPYFGSSAEAMAAANHHAYYKLGFKGGYSFHTRYGHLTLYGGTDYREWLVSLPDFQRCFFGAHHFDHNVLLHIRTTTRTDTQGHKLLCLEEIQSDWHQQGHMHGYDNNPWGHIANAPFKKEWALLAAKLMLIRASQNGFDGIAWPKGEIQELRYGKPLPAIARLYDKLLPDELDRLGKGFTTQSTTTQIHTCEPWLNLVKHQGKWRVEDSQGKFKTRNKYKDRDEAMQVIYRHSRRIDMDMKVFYLNEQLNWHIEQYGLPLFGTALK